MPRPPSLRVCYFGTYDQDYPRNRIFIDGLRANGVDVLICNVPLWAGTEEKVARAAGSWRAPRFLGKVLRTYLALLRQELRLPPYDVMLVGYPGQFDMPLARLLAWRRRVPLAFNVLMSLYLIVQERGLDRASPWSGRLIRSVEQLACRLADVIILDTTAYVDYFCREYRLSRTKFRLVPLGADQRLHHPVARRPRPDRPFTVAYAGTYIPLHGVEHIVAAAALLRQQTDIQFMLIGRGQLKPRIMAQAEELGLQNVTFIEWLEKEELREMLADADVCLGVFGTTVQSLITVQNKIWEGLAARKAVLTGDAPMLREVLVPGRDLWVCPRADPAALAAAIRVLYRDPALRARLAESGHRLIQEHYTVAHTGRRLRDALEEVRRHRR